MKEDHTIDGNICEVNGQRRQMLGLFYIYKKDLHLCMWPSGRSHFWQVDYRLMSVELHIEVSLFVW